MRQATTTKSARRFCVDCEKEQKMRIVHHKTFDMYHCVICGHETMRVGDGYIPPETPDIAGGIDAWGPDDFGIPKHPTIAARERADILSDEHYLWPKHDNTQREDLLRTFKAALSGLTARQKQVLDAVDQSGSASRAATFLGISQPVVTKTIQQIRKKLEKKGILSKKSS